MHLWLVRMLSFNTKCVLLLSLSSLHVLLVLIQSGERPVTGSGCNFKCDLAMHGAVCRDVTIVSDPQDPSLKSENMVVQQLIRPYLLHNRLW